MTRKLFILFVFQLLFFYGSLFGQDKVTTILLVRHAEKTSAPEDDPALTAQGTARAEFLVRMFEDAALTAIYTSQYARTRLTAEPLARKLGIQIQTVDAGATRKLADSILAKHSGETVLVIGHSNTLPEIVQALGAGKAPEIDDLDYDNLYVVTVSPKESSKLLRLKFFPTRDEQVCQ